LELALGAIIVFGLIGTSAILWASGAAGTERQPFQRLMRIVSAGRKGAEATAQETPGQQRPAPFAGLMQGIADRVSPRQQQRRLLRRLEAAGVADRVTPVGFLGLRVLAAVGGVITGLLVYRLLQDDPTWHVWGPLLAALLVGWLPELWLQDRTQSRQALIRKGLPEVLDLLVLSVEVGLGFDAAVARITRKMEGPLVDELRRLLRDQQLGQTRVESLRALAARCQVKEISSFTAAICQAEQLGGSMATSLRVQSRAMRVRYSQRLREQAAKLPIKMLFPLIMFIFPAIFIVLLGPGLMSLGKAFG
jgi:tight adherence protein C